MSFMPLIIYSPTPRMVSFRFMMSTWSSIIIILGNFPPTPSLTTKCWGGGGVCGNFSESQTDQSISAPFSLESLHGTSQRVTNRCILQLHQFVLHVRDMASCSVTWKRIRFTCVLTSHIKGPGLNPRTQIAMYTSGHYAHKRVQPSKHKYTKHKTTQIGKRSNQYVYLYINHGINIILHEIFISIQYKSFRI